MIKHYHSETFAPKFKIRGTNSTTLFQVLQSDNTPVFNVDTVNERVGIGTATPQELLHVGTGIDASDISATDLLVTRAGPSSLSVRDSTNNVETFLFASSVGGVMGTVTNDPLNIKTNNTSAVFIDASQKVGIRTDSPDSALHIKADVSGMVGNDYAGQIIIQNPANDVTSNAVITAYESDDNGDPDQQLWYLGNSSSGNSDIIFLNRRNASLHLGTNDTHRITILGNGNVMIGAGNPPTNATKLTIEGGLTFKEISAPTADSTYGKIWTDTSNELWFQSGGGTTHLLHGDSFSNIWFHGSTTGSMTVDVTISAQNALALINSFAVVGHEDDLSNLVGSASTNNLTLSAIGGGEYEISFHASVTATGGADKVMLVCLGITLATPKDITDVTDLGVSPIVITSIAHGLENGDMVEIVGVLGNDAANGSFIVSSKADDTFEIIDLSGGATTGDGDFDAGSPTGDITIEYPGNMIAHGVVRGADLRPLSTTGLHVLANSDKLALYVANLSGITNLTISTVSLSANRIGD